MIHLDDELTTVFLAECCEHVATIKADLLATKDAGAGIDDELASRLSRAVHSISGAGFFDLVKIGEVAHRMEDGLALVRSREILLTPHRVRVLLQATNKLHELIQNPGASNQADTAEIMAALAGLCAVRPPIAVRSRASAAGPADPGGSDLRVLLVEDDFASRLLLQTFLSRYGECHVAVNGREAVEAVRSALESGQRYDLICMDIMMPEMDGREAVRQIRALEEARGTLSHDGAKIIMTTAVDDIKEVIRCFKELCDAYLVKPIDLAQLLAHMRSYQLVP